MKLIKAVGIKIKKLFVWIYRVFIPITYVNLYKWPFLYCKNCRKMVKVINIEEERIKKKSDTLFILGCGSLIKKVTEAEWDVVRSFDSLAFNYFLYHQFVPTYFHFEYNRDPSVGRRQTELFKKRRWDYRNTVQMVSDRAWKRGMRPCLIPEWFSPDSTVCRYKYPKFVNCPATRCFRADDFKGRYMYRGTLNEMLYVAFEMRYKRIILLGCEMNHGVAFYEDYEEAQWAVNEIKHAPKEKRRKQLYGGMYPTKNKHPFDVTVHAFNDFVLKPAGIELHVARKESVLYPRVPYIDVMALKENKYGGHILT